MAILEIQNLPKLISRKIEWQIITWIMDLNFTFWKFLEHSATLYWFNMAYFNKAEGMSALFELSKNAFLQLILWKLYLLERVFIVHYCKRILVEFFNVIKKYY